MWLFAIVVALRLIIGLNSMINTRDVATSADGTPLDSFSPAAAQTVVSLFTLMSLSNLTFAVPGIVVLVHYRALVPFMFSC